MTESTTPLSGVDLARVALHNAREAAKQQGGATSPRRRRTATCTTRRTGGREPISFGEAIQQLIADRAWTAPVAAGGLLDRWSHIADDIAGRVTAVKYDENTATLTLQPDSSAAATAVRHRQHALLDRIAEETGGRETVRRLEILGPGRRKAA
ncbi:DciA family protein [Streptomyces albidoflavus]